MVIAMASGKGGTGKTTVAVNLACSLPTPIQLVDCDVEEPNTAIFFPNERSGTDVHEILIPQIDQSRCTACGACLAFCQFKALVHIERQVLVFPELCHGCGGCTRVCPQQAIEERGKRIGQIQTLGTGQMDILVGRLDVGVPLVPPLIRAVKARIRSGVSAIIDAPPGTSCPVVAALHGVDGVALVVEPTPFGLHDFGLAVEMVCRLGLPFGVVVNRAVPGDRRLIEFCEREGAPLLGEIPEDRRIAEAYARGQTVVEALPEYGPVFTALGQRLSEWIGKPWAEDGVKG